MIAYVHRNTKHLFELWRLFSQVIYLMCLHGNVYLCRYIYLRVYAHEYSAAYIWHSIWYTYIHMCVSHYYEFRAILHVHTHARAHIYVPVFSCSCSRSYTHNKIYIMHRWISFVYIISHLAEVSFFTWFMGLFVRIFFFTRHKRSNTINARRRKWVESFRKTKQMQQMIIAKICCFSSFIFSSLLCSVPLLPNRFVFLIRTAHTHALSTVCWKATDVEKVTQWISILLQNKNHSSKRQDELKNRRK